MTNQNPDLMLLREFAKQINAAPDTVYRWGTRGVKQPGGILRLKLKMTRMPGGWGVRQLDYDDFISKLNEGP